MRKFLKSVVAAVLVASMSVTGLATLASAKTTTNISEACTVNRVSYQYLPKPTTFTQGKEKFIFSENDADGMMGCFYGSRGQDVLPTWYGTGIPENLYYWAEQRMYTIEELSSKGSDCITNPYAKKWYYDTNDMKKYTGYTPANTAWNMAIELDAAVREAYYGLQGQAIIDFSTRLTFADMFWYLKQYCGYTDTQIANFKSDAKFFLKNYVNPTLKYYSQREYTDAEIEKYWDVLVLGFSYDQPTYAHDTASGSVNTKGLINVLDLKDDEVFWDAFGHAMTKQDMFNGNLATGASFDLDNVWATSAAKKTMGNTVNDWVYGKTAKDCYKKDFKVVATDSVTTTSDSKSTTPTLTKSAKIAKTQLNKVLKGLKAGTITMSNAEYKALRKLYQNSGMPSSEIKGKTFNKNLKIAMVQKLRYALPYMSNAQVKSLRTQLAGILA